MNGYVFVQMPKRQSGWIYDPYRLPKRLSPNGRILPTKVPKKAEEVLLTTDIEMAWRFDVDNVDGYGLLKDIMDKGGIVCVGGNLLRGEAPKLSASPFTPNN